jgi:hypothetical protein
MFVKEDGLLLFGGQRICGIAVCAMCSVKFGSEEGIFRCAKHGPSVTASSVPVAPVAPHHEMAKKPPRPPGVASRNVKRKNTILIERRTSPRFASVATTPSPSDAFWGGVTPQNLQLGLTPLTTEGLQSTEGVQSTMEVHDNNKLEATETAADDFEQSTEEWCTTSSSSFSNNDDSQSSSANNDATQSSSASHNDAAQLLLASSTKDAASFHTAPEKLLDKCSYRKCQDKSNQRDLVTCASATCNKKIHSLCFGHYIATNYDFPMRPGVVCCTAKACCAKFKLGNQGATTRWDSDGPNGPNSVPNSESVLVDWWSMGDNWSMYKGGRNVNGKTTTVKKEQVWKQLAELITQKGILVQRNPKSVGQKLSRMGMDFKKAHDFVHNTGSGLMSQGHNITYAVQKIFPYYYELEQVMGSRASVHPMDLLDGEEEEEAIMECNEDTMLEDDMVSRLSYSDGESAIVSSATKSGKASKSARSSQKRPLSLQKFESPSKVAKKHPALVLATNLSTAVEKAAAQKLQFREAVKVQNEAKLTMEKEWKEKELEQQQHWREKQVRWKDVEIKCLQDKTEV